MSDRVVTQRTTDAVGLPDSDARACAVASARLLIALDMDGTVLYEDGTASPAVADALRAAAASGHEVTFATGRSWQNVHPFIEEFGLDPEYVVCSNGAVTLRRADAAATSLPVDHGYVRDHVETFDARDVLQVVRSHVPDGGFMVERADGRRLYTPGMEDSTWNLGEAELATVDQLGDEPVSRVVVVASDQDSAEFLQVVERMGLHEVSYAVGWAAWLDIAPAGVNKGSALQRVVDRLGLPGEALLVVGDGRNDIEMFRMSLELGGRAVAMGQAPDEVKAAAGELAGTVDDDGLVDVLQSVVAVDAA